MTTKKAFGDFQTPATLARRAVSVTAEVIRQPDLVVEPTAGHGAFLKASIERWGNQAIYEGYEVNESYVDAARRALKNTSARVFHKNFLLKTGSATCPDRAAVGF
jgi:hypothetical protein